MWQMIARSRHVAVSAPEIAVPGNLPVNIFQKRSRILLKLLKSAEGLPFPTGTGKSAGNKLLCIFPKIVRKKDIGKIGFSVAGKRGLSLSSVADQNTTSSAVIKRTGQIVPATKRDMITEQIKPAFHQNPPFE